MKTIKLSQDELKLLKFILESDQTVDLCEESDDDFNEYNEDEIGLENKHAQTLDTILSKLN